MIDYDKAIASLDEWVACHASSGVIILQPTEKLFLDVFGKPFKFKRTDNSLVVMAKFNVLLMREILKDANKC